MPLDRSALVGNERLLAYLGDEIELGRLSHAYILEGPDGCGRHTLALSCAKALSEGNPAAEKIDRGSSPDIFELGLEGDRKTIGVELIRSIREHAYIKPTELDIKVFIVHDAELMTPQAQNALLKLLEEPPAGVYFFLLCRSASLLLPTVISRAPVLRMELFNEGALGDILCARSSDAAGMRESDPDNFMMLIRVANGSVGVALDMLERGIKGKSEGYSVICSLFDAIFAGRERFTMAVMGLPSKRDELPAVIGNIRAAIRDMIALKYTENAELSFFLDMNEASVMSDRFALSTLIMMDEAAGKIAAALETNINLYCAQLILATELYDAYSK